MSMQLVGKADIYVNGAWCATSQEGASIDGVAGVENSIVIASNGQSGGYTSKAIAGTIKANFLVGPTFDVTVFSAPGGVATSVAFVCDNGLTFQIADATFLKAESLDANKGLMAISFGGDVENLSS